MRILINCLFMQVNTFGGMEIFTINLSRAMAEAAPDVHFTIICGPGNKHYFSEFNFPNVEIKIINIPTERRAVRIIYEQYFLHRLASEWGTDVFFGPAHIIPLRLRCPSLLTIHDLHWFNTRDVPLLKRMYISRFIEKSIEKAGRIAIDSEFTKNDLNERFPGLNDENIEVIYPGIDDTFFRRRTEKQIDEALKEYRINRPYVLSVGQHHRRKNLPMLMRAYAGTEPGIKEKHDLVIAGGPGDEATDLPQLAEELGIAGKTVFTGIVKSAHLPAVYQGAELFVYPSSWEGFGLPVAEAMASGTPVICSSVTSLPEIGGDACEKVPPEFEPLTEAMNRILSNPGERESMKERGLERAKVFSWHNAARRYLEIIKELYDRREN